MTAYGVDLTANPTTLETSINVLKDGRQVALSTETEDALGIMPLPPLAGTTYDPVRADTMAAHTSGNSDGSVGITLVDPSRVTGNSYEVVFRDVAGEVVWDLINSATGATLLEGLPQAATDA